MKKIIVFDSMLMSMTKTRIFLSVTIGYACIALVIYLWISEGSRLTVRVQTEDEFLLVNEKEEFHPCQHIKYSSIIIYPLSSRRRKKKANKLKISEIKRETRHRTFLQTRTRCTQKYLLLILVPSSPLNFNTRRVIRQT